MKASNSKRIILISKIEYLLTSKNPEYLQQLTKHDKTDDDLEVPCFQIKIEILKNSMIKYEALETQLNESTQPRVKEILFCPLT